MRTCCEHDKLKNIKGINLKQRQKVSRIVRSTQLIFLTNIFFAPILNEIVFAYVPEHSKEKIP